MKTAQTKRVITRLRDNYGGGHVVSAGTRPSVLTSHQHCAVLPEGPTGIRSDTRVVAAVVSLKLIEGQLKDALLNQ